MEDVVAKAFNTSSRRFGVGDRVMAYEIDGPVSAETWALAGFLTDPSQPVVRPTAVQKPPKSKAAD
jgi:hypothetical protein